MKSKDLNKLIGFNLRTLRMEAKLTQEQLAERLSVSVGMIAKWETGAKGIGKNVLLKLCSVFGELWGRCGPNKLPYRIKSPNITSRLIV